MTRGKRAICHGSHWMDEDVVREEKKFFHFLPRLDRTRFHGIICQIVKLAPILLKLRADISFRESYHTRSSICHVYLVAYYHRIRLLHPSVIIMWLFLFVSVPASLLIERDGTTAAPDSLPRVIIAAGSGLLSHGSWISYALRYASDGSSSRAKIARYATRSGRRIGDADWIVWILLNFCNASIL